MQTLIKKTVLYRKISRNPFYCRLRSRFPMRTPSIHQDNPDYPDVEKVLLEWPATTSKPVVGIIRDTGSAPRWTKYCRFFENNEIPYQYYDINSIDWIEKARDFDAIIGIDSCEPYYLEQIRRKFYVIENHLRKKCYPTYSDLMMYEDKFLEAYLSAIYSLPFVKTYILNMENEALSFANDSSYPLVSKIVPSSGSVGVSLVKSASQCASIAKKVFSKNGRKTHTPYLYQKNYLYFQKFIPNDGYDIRIITIGNLFFGYYRKTLSGDFRASGMGCVEKRELPINALDIARKANDALKHSMLVVDLLHGLDNNYHIIEISPLCRIDTPEQLHVNGKPGVYCFDGSTYHFKQGKYWVHELALSDFFQKIYLSKG